MTEHGDISGRLPIVAIVGRPNVGKSTLFNRICGKRKAGVLNTPGLTRDRNYATGSWEGKTFLLIDTGGFEPPEQGEMFDLIREQIIMAVEEADAIIFLTDLNEPEHPNDEEIMNRLRQTKKAVFLAVNKCDTKKKEADATEFYRYGVERVHAVSATHGLGVAELLDDVVKELPERVATKEEKRTRIAVVGKQNVGKSTLTNRILGEKRVIVSEEPGTTRDAIDAHFEREGKLYTIIDTAGIRRRGKIKKGTEWLSVTSSIFSLERSDVAFLLLDGSGELTNQDTHIAGFAEEAGRACILVVNKWDLAKKKKLEQGAFVKKVREKFVFLSYAPIVFISAPSGKRVHTLFPLIDRVLKEAAKQIETPKLNRSFEQYIARNSPPTRKGRELKIKYAVQTGTAPPTFTLFVNDPALMHFSYERYLVNQLREEYGFEGTPVRIRLRAKGGK